MEIIYRIFCEVLSAFKGFFQKKYNNNMRCRYFIFFMDFISYITSFLLFFFLLSTIHQSNQTSKNCGYSSIISGLGFVLTISLVVFSTSRAVPLCQQEARAELWTALSVRISLILWNEIIQDGPQGSCDLCTCPNLPGDGSSLGISLNLPTSLKNPDTGAE